MSMKMKYEMRESDMIIATAPERRITRRPHLSTRYHGGTVASKYVMPLIPVMRIASRPTHPADSKTSGA